MRARIALGAGLVSLAAVAVEAHPGLHHDIASATVAIEKEPRKADLYVDRAYLERLDEEFDAALADLNRARELDPANPRVAAERGMTLSALGRYKEADVELTRFVASGRHRSDVRGAGQGARAAGPRTTTRSPTTGRRSPCSRTSSSTSRAARSRSRAVISRAPPPGYRDGREKLGDAVALDLALIRVETSRRRYAAALTLIDAAARPRSDEGRLVPAGARRFSRRPDARRTRKRTARRRSARPTLRSRGRGAG